MGSLLSNRFPSSSGGGGLFLRGKSLESNSDPAIDVMVKELYADEADTDNNARAQHVDENGGIQHPRCTLGETRVLIIGRN